MKVREIKASDSRDVERFIRFPFQLYEGNEYWVPPLLPEMRAVFDRTEHPFYQHSRAGFFLAEDKAVAGRVAVLENRHYNEFHAANTAFFYFFEAVNQKEVARALFDKAFQWASDRGLETIKGPMGFHALDGRGILVKGFDVAPATGIPYNPPYYHELLHAIGFRKKSDFQSGLASNLTLPPRVMRVAERVRKRRELWIKSFQSKKEAVLWVSLIKQIYNKTFVYLEDHYPMTEREIRWAVERLLSIADPRLIKLMMKGAEPIGFILVYPNVTRGIKKAKGKLWPFGWLYILWEAKFSRWLDFNGIAILPQYRGLGANALLYSELAKSVRQRKAQRAEVVQVEEENWKSLGEANLFDIDWCKTHRVYVKEI